MHNAKIMNTKVFEYLVIRIAKGDHIFGPDLFVASLRDVVYMKRLTKSAFAGALPMLKSMIFSGINGVWVNEGDHVIFDALLDDAEVTIVTSDVTLQEMCEKSLVRVDVSEIKVDRDGDIWFVAHLDGGGIVESNCAITPADLEKVTC